MKRAFGTVLCLVLFMFDLSAFAYDRLTDSLLPMIGSKHYLIKYESHTYSESSLPAVKALLKNMRAEITLMQNGDDTLCVVDAFMNGEHESHAYLYTNGESYEWKTKNRSAVNNDYTPNVKEILHQIGKGEKRSKKEFEFRNSHIIKDFMLPLIVEKYKEKGVEKIDGIVLGKLENCSIFNKTGEERINNILYYFEELKAPHDYHLPNYVRYYFSNGKLAKCIRFWGKVYNDYTYDLTMITEQKKDFGEAGLVSIPKEVCSYDLLQVMDIRTDFNLKCLELPQGVKVQNFVPKTIKGYK